MNIRVNISLCRVCMKSQTGISMLNDAALQLKFEFVTHLRVKSGDDMPDIICEKCLVLLNLCDKFIQSAQNTETNLKLFLAKLNSDFRLVTRRAPTNELDNIIEFLDVETSTQQPGPSKEKTNEEVALPIAEIKRKKVITSKIIEIEKSTIEQKPSTSTKVSIQPSDELCLTTTQKEISSKGDVKLKSSTKPVLQPSNIANEHDELMTFECLDDILVTEDDNTQLDEEINNDVYMEEYEALLDDENASMDILSEETEDLLQSDKIDDGEILVLDEIPSKVSKASTSSSTKRTSSSRGGAGKKATSTTTENTRFFCVKCNSDFSTKTNLTRHMQLHEGKRPYECKLCYKTFSQNGTLKQHMYTHTGEKPYVCKICKRGFTQSKSLVFHMRRHTGEKPHLCDFCGTLYRQKDALKMHILKNHTDVNECAFSCKICNMEISAQELANHMKRHLNNHKTTDSDTSDIMQFINETELLSERVLIGDELSLNVDGSTHVIDLMATSAMEPNRAKKYQCRQCFKCFQIKKSLLRHLSFHEAAVSDLYQCDVCDLAFESIQALKIHREHDHSDIGVQLSSCDDCEIVFPNDIDLQNHLKVKHIYKCMICDDVSFANKKLLRSHLIKHNIMGVEELPAK